MRASLVCLTVLLVGPASAHDLWLTATPATAADGVTISLQIGEHGVVEPVALAPARIERLFVRSSGQDRTIPLAAPAERLDLALAADRVHSIGYVGMPSLSTLPAEAFDRYLEEEHLDQVIAARRTQPGSSEPVRENFSRSLKAVVPVASAPLVDCPIGIPLELVVVRTEQDHLVVRALFGGTPVAGLWVDRGDSNGKVIEEMRTDSEGTARFAFDTGAWILRATHMRPDASSAGAWRSWWATTTFAVGSAPIEACDL